VCVGMRVRKRVLFVCAMSCARTEMCGWVLEELEVAAAHLSNCVRCEWWDGWVGRAVGQ